MTETIETVVTFLEMTAKPATHVPRPSNFKLMLMRAEHPSVGFYRFLYDAVGRSYTWIDRKKLSDDDLSAILRSSGVEVWVLYIDGAPAGFFEITATDPNDVELEYFGLIPQFHGRGLGKWLLQEAIAACWVHNPKRVRVETCTLDGPVALPLYQKMGFVPVARESKTMSLLD